MHLIDIRIDEIVEVDGLPAHARGTAAFSNGRDYEFYANFAHGYGEDSVIILRCTDARYRLTQIEALAKAIRDELGFAGIAQRERDAIASFELERVAACKRLMRTGDTDA